LIKANCGDILAIYMPLGENLEAQSSSTVDWAFVFHAAYAAVGSVCGGLAPSPGRPSVIPRLQEGRDRERLGRRRTLADDPTE
jgi:hypothetical protein